MSEWVKFHRSLNEGGKRGIKRGHRYVYMELSLKARPGRGTIELPVGMTDEAAVLDLLGGDASELKAALKVLAAGDDPLIRFFGEPGRRLLEVLTWCRWNALPGESTERVKRHRDEKRNALPAAEGTQMKRVTPIAATEAKQVPSGEESREEKRREDLTGAVALLSPPGNREPGPPPPDEVFLDANGRAILEELQRHPKLRELADARTASAIAGRIMVGTRLEDVLHAIDEAAFDLLEGSTAEVARSKLRKYVQNAKPQADTKRAKRGGPPAATPPAERGWTSHSEREPDFGQEAGHE